MKTLYTINSNLITDGRYTLNDVSVTAGASTFAFPANATLNHLISVKVNQESAFDDVIFQFKTTLSNVTGSSRLGIYLKSATDLNGAEQAGFVIGGGNITFYVGNTSVIDLGDYTLANGNLDISMRRKDDYYYFTVGNITVERRIKGDGGAYYRQNVTSNLYGSDITVAIKKVKYYTPIESLKFGLIGDSIANGYSSAGGGWEDTIKGIMVREKKLSFGEFAGSANIIKDTIDAFNELRILKPKYVIVMYGHNDLYFTTGRHHSDYRKLIALIQDAGMIPIICTLTPSTWITIDTQNDFLRKTYFNKFLHVDLSTVITYPDDYRDGAHPNVQGNRKIANTIYTYIQNLP